MNNSMENGEDPFADFWISNWERQCEIELENEPDLEGQVLSERDLSTQKLWHLFQNSATSVAQLFKGNIVRLTMPKSSHRSRTCCAFTDRNQPQVLWLPFQTAAGTITSLYKGKLSIIDIFSPMLNEQSQTFQCVRTLCFLFREYAGFFIHIFISLYAR